MDTIKTPERVDQARRRFFGAAALTVAAVQLGAASIAQAQTSGSAAAAPWRPQHTSFAPLKQVDAGVLNVGYAEDGPADGTPVILLHGWPYDIHSFVDVAPLLAAKGYRVIVPYLRGYGTTRFLSSDTLRNGQPSAVAARHHRPDGRAEDREGRRRRLRLGRAHRRHHRRAVAGARARRWSR